MGFFGEDLEGYGAWAVSFLAQLPKLCRPVSLFCSVVASGLIALKSEMLI